MADRIYITYTHVVSSLAPFYHAVINFERTDASGNVLEHKIIEGTPEHTDLTTSQKAYATIEEKLRTDNGESAFGHIRVLNTNGPLEQPVLPYEVLKTGDDLSGTWSRLETYASAFDAAGYARSNRNGIPND
jgi:hypothetical protein